YGRLKRKERSKKAPHDEGAHIKDSGYFYCDLLVEYIPDNSVISIYGTNKKCPVRTGQIGN
ncbi:hypothetical protein, partial [Morganella morganii]|uniref:hypothetical protein n=1 Tax=Morganella morganii TaxID=582 RepID=UPI001C71210E